MPKCIKRPIYRKSYRFWDHNGKRWNPDSLYNSYWSNCLTTNAEIAARDAYIC